jgi:hypothetical protein
LGNAEQVERAGLGRAAVAGGTDSTSALATLGASATVALDAMPVGEAFALARSARDNPAVTDWLVKNGANADGSVLGFLASTVGCETEEPRDGGALARQTADNFLNATEKLATLGEWARNAGETKAAEVVERSLGRLAGAQGLAEQLVAIHMAQSIGDLFDTSRAVLAVDMNDPEKAAAAFDAWFEAAGTVGEDLVGIAGPWAPVLKPFATLFKEMGGSGFFTRVKYGREAHGMHGANREAVQMAERDGYL